MPTRRQLLSISIGVVTAPMLLTCRTKQTEGSTSAMTSGRLQQTIATSTAGRLRARPQQQQRIWNVRLGEQPLKLDDEREGLLYVPAGYRADRRAPFALMLHGAGGNAEHGISLFRHFADEAGLIVLAPQSRRQTWDVIIGGFGPDIAFIDRALEQTFSRYNIDPARLAIGGFSDGASYALSVGITNGALFTHVVAFSPGFVAPGEQQGLPRLFISHGTHDQVLPIDRCSRRIVPQVKRANYNVRYREFDGAHTVPLEVAGEAVEWLTMPQKTDRERSI